MTAHGGRPPILITCAADVAGEAWQKYADCVARAGGEPVLVDARDFRGIEALPAHAGILVTAGVDVDPSRYGQEQSERVTEIDPQRDEVEEALIGHAIDSELPLLCICRGAQLLNTSRGGQLLQHIEERDPHRARRAEDDEERIDSGWHEVTVARDSLLARVTGSETLWVNSRHHQAVLPEWVAPGLDVTAVAPDGIVEGLELPGAAWLLGVQWHPELPEMTEDPRCHAGSVRLFEAFVEACREAE